jgi:hypothetical protein
VHRATAAFGALAKGPVLLRGSPRRVYPLAVLRPTHSAAERSRVNPRRRSRPPTAACARTNAPLPPLRAQSGTSQPAPTNFPQVFYLFATPPLSHFATSPSDAFARANVRARPSIEARHFASATDRFDVHGDGGHREGRSPKRSPRPLHPPGRSHVESRRRGRSARASASASFGSAGPRPRCPGVRGPRPSARGRSRPRCPGRPTRRPREPHPGNPTRRPGTRPPRRRT